MNTAKLLFVLGGLLIVTGIFLIGCSDQPETSFCPVGVMSEYFITDSSEVVLFAGQDIPIGHMYATISGEDLCFEYVLDGEWELVETHLWVGTSYSDMPQNRKGNPQIGHFPYASSDISGDQSWMICIPLTDLSNNPCELDLLIAAHAAVRLPIGIDEYQTETAWADGIRMVDRGNWATYYSFSITCQSGEPIDDSFDCETAFGMGDYATCFLDLAGDEFGFSRWGWTNGPLTAGNYTFDLWAGAAQCDLSKGTLVGQVTVDYDGATATVNYQTFDDFVMDEVHIYVGNDVLPIDNNGEYTIAPGQYGYVMEELGGATYHMASFDISGDIYVVAHAVVCGPPVCDEWIVYGSWQGTNPDPNAGNDAIYAYDLNARTQTLVYDPGNISSNGNYPNANAYDPVNERIYFGTNDGRLFYHQIGSGTHVQVASGYGTMHNAAWYDGHYYYVQGYDLYKVTIDANDVATRVDIGNVPYSAGYGDLAFDPHNPGYMIGSLAGGAALWYVYDVNTHQSWALGTDNISDNHKQLAYGSDGILYAVEATTGDFYTVTYDLNSGVTLTPYWNSVYRFTDLASGPQCQ